VADPTHALILAESASGENTLRRAPPAFGFRNEIVSSKGQDIIVISRRVSTAGYNEKMA
jgi:hypothetical protein